MAKTLPIQQVFLGEKKTCFWLKAAVAEKHRNG